MHKYSQHIGLVLHNTGLGAKLAAGTHTIQGLSPPETHHVNTHVYINTYNVYLHSNTGDTGGRDHYQIISGKTLAHPGERQESSLEVR